ncbi:hypothetical protein [Stenotrophomonas sp. TWI587]|uniref:hypothetical protein n=1 Tax=Stenotrophomonas sp. TWI587 TaxID=3136783 RepID=UPI00320A18EF
MFIVLNRGPVGVAIVVAIVCLVIPPLLAFQGFPTRNDVMVMPDGLVFSRRDAVPFGELSRWGTDDYLTLVRRGRTTLMVSAADQQSRDRLLREFQHALDVWQRKQPAVSESIRRTHFYGSARAAAMGAVIVALGALCIFMALRLREPSIELAIVGALGGLFGVFMLLGRRL